MLLPKRVEKHIRRRIPDCELAQEEINRRLLKGYVNMQPTEDKYLLDSENAIVVLKKEEDNRNKPYLMCHQRLVNRNLVEMNRWYLPSYDFGGIHSISVLSDLGLFKVQNGQGDFGSLYDYINGKFVVCQGDFEQLDFGSRNEILKEYHGMIGSFSISSDYKKGDLYHYTNAITGVRGVRSFKVRKGNYYAMINLDGSIRGNKLFRGKSFSEPEEMIELDNYESLDAFKREVKEECNREKQELKKKFFQNLEERETTSPYLDQEVADIIKVKSSTKN